MSGWFFLACIVIATTGFGLYLARKPKKQN